MEKIKADFLLLNAGQLVTVAGNSDHPKRGKELNEIGVIADGAVAARDGVIVAVGTTDELQKRVELTNGTVCVDACGKVVLPGLVDPHTHVVFAGSREHELEMKIKGVPYLDILAAGGVSSIQFAPPERPAGSNWCRWLENTWIRCWHRAPQQQRPKAAMGLQ